ncbi:MAG: hypothetical protein ACM3UU_06935 [Ignavibacteriales bacterium]
MVQENFVFSTSHRDLEEGLAPLKYSLMSILGQEVEARNRISKLVRSNGY